MHDISNENFGVRKKLNLGGRRPKRNIIINILKHKVMKTYRFIYNNNDSQHICECDEEAMKEALSELKLIHKYNKFTLIVHVWELKPNGKFKYVGNHNI